MAHIQDRKSNFYSQRQSVRDELSAPRYLESAGDELIKHLAKKQTNTTTSLEEQLEVVQNFEKGFDLSPDDRRGILSLKDFKRHVLTREETSTSPIAKKHEEVRDLDELMRITGLTRHELELGLCEKPSSKISQLYMFAIANKSQKRGGEETLEERLPDHPINHLKEIEDECFGRAKKAKNEIKEDAESEKNAEESKRKKERKRRHRKRRKKTGEITGDNGSKVEPIAEAEGSPIPEKREEAPKASSSTSRLSLWDVKDMKKWGECKEIGCEPQAFYTIKNGKIIKVEKESGREDTT